MFLREFDAANEASTKAARTALLEYLGVTSGSYDEHAVKTIFGELVGNVWRHATNKVTVGASWRMDGTAILEVIDRGPGFDLSAWRPADSLAEHGRGLLIANALSGLLTIAPGPGGAGTWIRAVLPFRKTHVAA